MTTLPQSEIKVCTQCMGLIGDDETPVARVRRGEPNVPLWFHQRCWDQFAGRLEREKQQRIEDHQRLIKNRFLDRLQGRDGTGTPTVGGVPKWEYARLDNDEFCRRASPKYVQAMRAYRAGPGGLVLSGPTGRGKTACVVAWLWAQHQRDLESADDSRITSGMIFYWVTGPELAAARRNAPLGEEAWIVTEAKSVPVLVLDELGYEPMTEILFEVVDHRYRQNKTTIVTTGLTPRDFRRRYGDALWRRLAEGGIVVEDWPTQAVRAVGGQRG